ncbi:hypothetical protein KSC_070630 [Ktedonobacter sp. SOSP1-52]|uniref:hypothetical protein n=1 Tax=Ktedonobacter sp. SOSP1-52 TaxID=2778366 RepID=UPI001916757F|nr:hypothetical protein [Ktedonobacter sp. SOSP1-52]GHO68171.1 hypothetical protein KSC_070630 [Ktedonobacter sp. SOSP1-52]
MSNNTETPHATRRWQFRRLLGSLAAILVVGMLIAVALLFFTPHQTLVIGAAIGPVRAPSTTSVQAGGFEMTLGITPGPYFISEMLEVNITLTNHTSKMQFVGIPFANSPCGYVDGITVQGEQKPAYELPAPTTHKCPPLNNTLTLSSGQTLSMHKYFVLQNSGDLTLTTQAGFFTKTQQEAAPIPSPLDGHWPTLRIHVASQVPQDRQLTLHISAPRVSVDAPAPARPHLQYLYSIFCANDRTASSPMGDSYGTGNYGWETLHETTLNLPGCSRKHITWSFGIGAPGYAIASGKAQLDV